MQAYDTLLAAINGLRAEGYNLDFNINFDSLLCQQSGICLNPAQFEIVQHYRFEGNSDPDDSSILYAIESLDGTMKGLLVNAYGVYSDAVSDEMVRKLALNIAH
jgi:hypothetical protein